MDHTDRGDRSPAVAELLDDAYVSPVGVETAARHLWVIHTEAERLRREREADEAEAPLAVAAVARWSVPRAAVPLLLVVMLMSSSGVALAASQSSLPGDVLYPVKRGTENAQLVFTRNPSARAELQLAFARTRLDEIRALGTTRPEHIPALVADITLTLSEVEQAAPEVADASEQIRRQTSDQIAQMTLPGEITQAVDQAMTAPPPVQGGVAATTATPVPTPGETRTPTAPDAPTAGTATEVAAPGAGTPTAPGSTPPATGTPTASPSPSPTPAPSEGAGTGTQGPTPAGTPGGVTPDPSAPAPSTPEQPSPPVTGPVVTPRPHPSPTDQGESRSDDGSGQVDDDPVVQPTPSEAPVLPYTRPDDPPPPTTADDEG